jgi:uncharacterized protein involved in exopolysaccharide biosynthesis
MFIRRHRNIEHVGGVERAPMAPSAAPEHRPPRGQKWRAQPYGSAPSSHLTLIEIRDFLRLYGWSILACCIAALSLAATYINLTPSIFMAQTQVLLEPQAPNPISQGRANSDRPLDSPEIESQIALLRSEKIAFAVINELRLDLENRNLITRPNKAPTYGAPETLLHTHAIIEAFTRHLDVRRNGLSYAIDVSFSSRNPELAARIANAVAQAYLNDQLETRAQAIRAGSRWLEDRIEHIRRQMNEATLRVQRFRLRRDYSIGDAATKAAADNKDDDGKQETLEELESRAQTTRRMFESYLQAYTESLQTQTYAVNNARIITPALHPLSPSWPRPWLLLAFALLNGVIIGVGQALLRYQLTQR